MFKRRQNTYAKNSMHVKRSRFLPFSKGTYLSLNVGPIPLRNGVGGIVDGFYFMLKQSLSYLFSTASITLILLATIISSAYIVLKPTIPELSTAQQRLVDCLDTEVGQWLGEIEPARRTAILVTLHRDPFAQISDRLRNVVWRSDRFDLSDYSLMEKFLKRLEWKRPTAESRKEALQKISWRKSDYVIWGSVVKFSDVITPAKLVVDLEVVEVANGKLLAEKRFELLDKPGLIPLVNDAAGWSADMFHFSLLTGLLIWIGFTLLLPLIFYPLIKHVVLGESNAAILATLAGTVFASIFMCYLVLLRGNGPWLNAIVLLIAFGIALCYYYKTFEAIKTLNE